MNQNQISQILASLDSLAVTLRAVADSPIVVQSSSPPESTTGIWPPSPEIDTDAAQAAAAKEVADAMIAGERENILDRTVDRLVADERIRNAVALALDHDAIAERIADTIHACDVLDRIDFDNVADRVAEQVSQDNVVEAVAEQIAGSINFDRVVAAAAAMLAEQIMARLPRA